MTTLARALKAVVALLAVVLVLLLLAAGVFAWSNTGLRTQSSVLDRLPPAEKARLEETLHLKRELGPAIWPGWAEADIPFLLYNERNAFLVGYPDPPAGWAPVANDTFAGAAYDWQAWPHPQAFAEKIGTRWVASMATKERTEMGLVESVRGDLPGFLKPIFPYRLAVPLYTSDWHMMAYLHESLHAYQATVAPARFQAALDSYHDEGRCPWDDTAVQAEWHSELGLLARAVDAEADAQAADLARQFIAQRERRRAQYHLDAACIGYERQMEWLEGLAKYVELDAWRRAAHTAGYTPVDAIKSDAEFKNYADFDARWPSEIAQMSTQGARKGDGRFYYTGMAQAMLLQRLAPGWQARVLQDGVWLEALLSAAVNR